MLDGKTALVTGASRGVGRAIALTLAARGADVVITYVRRREAAEGVAEEIRALGRRCEVQRFDASRAEEVDRLFDEIAASIGHLDIFVSNAVSATMRPIEALQDRHWQHILDANLTAFFRGSRRALALMVPRGGGSIVALSSVGSRACPPNYAALGVAKAGIETLARYMALEWADRGINVNVVCGGPIDTEALDAFDRAGVDLDAMRSDLRRRTPAGRLGTPQDLAGIVAFLCTPDGAWIRGQTILADGGMMSTIWVPPEGGG